MQEGSKHGWGIGLPYDCRVAESHGGSVDVDSGGDRGSTFLIDISVDSRPYQTAPVLGESPQQVILPRDENKQNGKPLIDTNDTKCTWEKA